MSIPVKTEGQCSGWSYPVLSRATAVVSMCAVALLLSSGCAQMAMMKSGSASDHIEYMSRAAQADPDVRRRMKREAEEQMKNDPVSGRLRIGFLLTSPGEDDSSIQAGEQILKRVLAESTGLAPQIRNLVELRLAEVEARQSLRSEVRDVEDKIERLLSIESAMERKKSQEQTRPR